MFLIVRSSFGSGVAALATQVNLHLDTAQTSAERVGELGAEIPVASQAERLAKLSKEMEVHLRLIRSEQAAASTALASLKKETRSRAYRDYLGLVEDAFARREKGLELAGSVIGEITAGAAAASALERTAQSWDEALRAGDTAAAREGLEASREALEAAARGSRVLESWPGLSQAIERHSLVVSLALRKAGEGKREMDRTLEGPERFAAQMELITLLPEWEKRWDELSPQMDAAREEFNSAQEAARKADQFYGARWGPAPEREREGRLTGAVGSH